MHLRTTRSLTQVWPATVLAMATGSAMTGWEHNISRGVIPISQVDYDSRMLTLWVCAGIGVEPFGAIFTLPSVEHPLVAPFGEEM